MLCTCIHCLLDYVICWVFEEQLLTFTLMAISYDASCFEMLGYSMKCSIFGVGTLLLINAEKTTSPKSTRLVC